MHWELEELERCLYEGDLQLAKRYLSKLKEQLFCSKCKQPILYSAIDASPYFKGKRHNECLKEK